MLTLIKYTKPLLDTDFCVTTYPTVVRVGLITLSKWYLATFTFNGSLVSPKCARVCSNLFLARPREHVFDSIKAGSGLSELNEPLCGHLPSLSRHSVVTIGPPFSRYACSAQPHTTTLGPAGFKRQLVRQLYHQDNGPRWVKNAINT